MKDIKGFEGLYAITKDGQVWSYPKEWVSNNKLKQVFKKKGIFLKLSLNKKGYLLVRLCASYQKKSFLVHRLVAKAFIPNILNKDTVNHINGIKIDNRVENLEWCSNIENMRHGYKIGLFKNKIKNQKRSPLGRYLPKVMSS